MLPLIVVLALASSPTVLPPPPEIELLTIGPGATYWERFGHNAIVVRYPDGGPAISYNYGIFDFGQHNFLLNFVRGRMNYRLAGLDADREVAAYQAADRSVFVQTLALTNAQKRELATFLERNRQPEHASYRYDYFLANCSTKVRDALDLALGGALSDQFRDQPTGHTFRGFTNRYAAPVPWLYLGTQLGLARPTDRKISRWEAFFVPHELRLGLELATIQDERGRARNLVSASRSIHQSERFPIPAEPPRWFPWFLLVGLAVAIAIALGGPRLGRGLAGGWWLVSTVTGTLMLLLWLATDHDAAHANENLLLFSPLCLLGTVALVGAPPRRRTAWLVVTLILAPVAALLILSPTGLLYQHNGEFVALALPIHAAAAWTLLRAAERARAD